MKKRNNELSAHFSKLPYGLSHIKSALDYLLAEKATGKLTLQKIIAKKEKGEDRRVSRARNKRQTTLSRMKYWAAGNSWFCRITVIEQCKYMRRDMCRPAERRRASNAMKKRSSPSGTIHDEHVRNIHAFPRTHRRIAGLYICIHACNCVCVYTHVHMFTCVACYGYALACTFTVIDRPSNRTHLSTCHYTSGTSVLCTVTLRENDDLGWRTRIYYTAYSRDANNDRDCNREPCISPDSICCCVI